MFISKFSVRVFYCSEVYSILRKDFFNVRKFIRSFDDQDLSQHLTWSDRDSQTIYNGIVSILQKYTAYIVILYQNGSLA